MPSRSYRSRTRTLIGTRTQRRCTAHGPLVGKLDECAIDFIPWQGDSISLNRPNPQEDQNMWNTGVRIRETIMAPGLAAAAGPRYAPLRVVLWKARA